MTRLFPVPPELPDELERVATWVEVITGLRLDKQQGLIQVLDNAAWLERRERLMQLGGPPETGPEQRLDPILFGPDPTARARSFMERKQWDAAEAAFDEARRARPFNMSIVVERGDLYAHRGLWSEAAAYYATTSQAVSRRRAAPRATGRHAAPGGRPARLPGRLCRDAGAVQADRRFHRRRSRGLRVQPRRPRRSPICAGLIQVSERSTRLGGRRQRAQSWARSCSVPAAWRKPSSASSRRTRVFEPRAWDLLFLAMIHSRLGQTSEARRLLEQADQWIVEADKAPSGTEREGARWSDLTEKPTILLLRREAEAVIRSGPVFPADPFAR